MESQAPVRVTPGALLVEELRRIRADFESEARQYHSLSLSVYYLAKGERASDLPLAHPHHAITLWQYMGDGEETWDAMRRPQPTAFGLADAELTALGVIAGPATGLFLRMAARSASLIPDEVAQMLAVGIVNQIRTALDGAESSPTIRKPIFSSNSNALAVWLNFVLSIVSTYQPERFRGNKLEVDPFAGSLAAIDFLLEILQKPEGTRIQQPPSGEILELKPGIWGISVNLRELWRQVRRWWSGRRRR